MSINVDLSNKKTIAGLIILIGIVSIIFYLPNIISLTNPTVCTIDGVCQHEERVNLLTALIPIAIISGVIIGAIVFFFMSVKLEKQNDNLENVTQTLIQFLNKDEKKIVEKIIENDGKIYQSELSRIEGIGKLKSHRIIRRLEERNVIEIEKHGKTNIIKLKKEIKTVLLK
ncbi:MAG: hypothetical protein WC915_05095 [archaeon]|jgi:uncharacterized membrane protein